MTSNLLVQRERKDQYIVRVMHFLQQCHFCATVAWSEENQEKIGWSKNEPKRFWRNTKICFAVHLSLYFDIDNPDEFEKLK